MHTSKLIYSRIFSRISGLQLCLYGAIVDSIPKDFTAHPFQYTHLSRCHFVNVALFSAGSRIMTVLYNLAFNFIEICLSQNICMHMKNG